MLLRRFPLVCSAALLLGSHQPCIAQPNSAADEIRLALDAAGRNEWSDAVRRLQRVISTRGNELMPAPSPIDAVGLLGGSRALTFPWTSPRSVQARWVCHQQIGRLPPALELYRRRVDAVADKLWKEFGDNASDREVFGFLGEWYNARAGEAAILRLAQSHFDQAELGAAIHYWTMLLPTAGEELAFPDPTTPRALTEARILLARLFRGEELQVAAALKDFRKRHPKSSGLLAGHDGNYADTLAALLRDPRRTTIAPPPGDGREWATFAGFPTRNAALSSNLPRNWSLEPDWRYPLVDEPLPPNANNARTAKLHPVIANGRVFVSNGRQILAIDMRTGEGATIFPPKDGVFERGSGTNTLMFADGMLYAKISSATDAERGDAIVALGPVPAEPVGEIAHAWTLRSVRDPKEGVRVFAGPPLVVGGRLFVAVRRQEGPQAIRAIACYRLSRENHRPELSWEHVVGRIGGRQTDDAGEELLTQAADAIVTCSPDGTVTAIDMETGTPRWELRSRTVDDRIKAPVRAAIRENLMHACLFDGESVFTVTPARDNLLCLDAWSGRLKWQRDGLNVSHLYGAANGRLFVTVDGQLKGVRALDRVTGSDAPPFGWLQHADSVATAGRGFVTPEAVCWPTRRALYLLNPRDGSPIGAPLEGDFGNLAFTDGRLVVVTASEIRAYGVSKRLRPPLPLRGNQFAQSVLPAERK